MYYILSGIDMTRTTSGVSLMNKCYKHTTFIYWIDILDLVMWIV